MLPIRTQDGHRRVHVTLNIGRDAARVASVLLVAFAATWFGASVGAQQAPPSRTPPQISSGRVFASDAGIILNPVKPGATADFEMVMARLKAALAGSKDPTRQQQAKSWKIFRAQEPGLDGAVLYVFVMDPAVKGADYSVTKALAEAFPTEVQALYEKYSAAFAGPATLINLTLLAEKIPATTLVEVGLPRSK
jgi:hypothetical protein